LCHRRLLFGAVILQRLEASSSANDELSVSDSDSFEFQPTALFGRLFTQYKLILENGDSNVL
jgi:hypothetical protein